MQRSRLKIMLLLFGAGLLPGGVWGQYPKVAKKKPGNLNGTVVTAKGTPVADAQILWQVADGETPHVLHSDSQGHFHIGPLPPGLYEVRASLGGTWSEWQHNVMVGPGDDANVTLRLAFKAAPIAKPVELHGTMLTWDIPVPGAMPQDSASDLKGNIWFTLRETGHLARFTPSTHEWKLFKVPTPNSGPQGITADAGGNLWFAENYAGKIGLLDPVSGAVTEYVPPSAKDPQSLAFGPDGGLWFTSENSNLIGRLDISTGKITEFSVLTQNAHPYGLVSASDGGLWFCELAGQRLGRVQPESGVITEFTPREAGLVHPRDLVSVDGAIFFTDLAGGRLGRLTFADKKFKFWDSPSGANSQPYAIAADQAGNIWYEESAESVNKLVRFNPTVEIFAVFSVPVPGSTVGAIGRDSHGQLWIPLSAPNKIMVVQ